MFLTISSTRSWDLRRPCVSPLQWKYTLAYSMLKFSTNHQSPLLNYFKSNTGTHVYGVSVNMVIWRIWLLGRICFYGLFQKEWMKGTSEVTTLALLSFFLCKPFNPAVKRRSSLFCKHNVYSLILFALSICCWLIKNVDGMWQYVGYVHRIWLSKVCPEHLHEATVKQKMIITLTFHLFFSRHSFE